MSELTITEYRAKYGSSRAGIKRACIGGRLTARLVPCRYGEMWLIEDDGRRLRPKAGAPKGWKKLERPTIEIRYSLWQAAKSVHIVKAGWKTLCGRLAGEESTTEAVGQLCETCKRRGRGLVLINGEEYE